MHARTHARAAHLRVCATPSGWRDAGEIEVVVCTIIGKALCLLGKKRKWSGMEEIKNQSLCKCQRYCCSCECHDTMMANVAPSMATRVVFPLSSAVSHLKFLHYPLPLLSARRLVTEHRRQGPSLRSTAMITTANARDVATGRGRVSSP